VQTEFSSTCSTTMSSNEVSDLKHQIADLHVKLDQFLDSQKDTVNKLAAKMSIIHNSLRACQQRCHVDNPPGRWRNLGRAVKVLFTWNSTTPSAEITNVQDRAPSR